MSMPKRSKTELPLLNDDSSPLIEWGCGLSKQYLERIQAIEKSLCDSIAVYDNAVSTSDVVEDCPICYESTDVDVRVYFECSHWTCEKCGDVLKRARASCHMCRAQVAIIDNLKYGIWATIYIENDATCHIYTFGREKTVHSLTNITHINHRELESFLQELLEHGGKLVVWDAYTFHRWLRQLNIRLFDRQDLLANTFNI